MDRWAIAFAQGGPSPIEASKKAFKAALARLHEACVEGDTYAAKLHYRSANTALTAFIKFANLQSPPGSQLQIFSPPDAPSLAHVPNE